MGDLLICQNEKEFYRVSLFLEVLGDPLKTCLELTRTMNMNRMSHNTDKQTVTIVMHITKAFQD